MGTSSNSPNLKTLSKVLSLGSLLELFFSRVGLSLYPIHLEESSMLNTEMFSGFHRNAEMDFSSTLL